MNILKNTTVLLLSLCILCCTTGFQVFQHYCGGYLASTSILVSSNPCQDEQGEESCHKNETRKCCSDQDEYVQLDIDLLSHTAQHPQFKNQDYTPMLLSHVQSALDLKVEMVDCAMRAPPRPRLIPLFLIHSQFTFYG